MESAPRPLALLPPTERLESPLRWHVSEKSNRWEQLLELYYVSSRFF
jgi:hypothetical protein